MAPLRKPASRSMERGSSPIQEERIAQQYGRSSSNLHAELAAASLRDSARSPGSSRPSSTKGSRTLLRKKSAPAGPPMASLAPLPVPQRRPSYVPTVSSPLNPSSPTGSIRSHDSESPSIGEGSSNSAESPQSTNEAQVRGLLAPGIPPPSSPRNIPGRPSPGGGLRPQRSSPALRPRTPVSLSDLGRDYSRYPFPKRNSYTDSLPPNYNFMAGTATASSSTSSLNPANPFRNSASEVPGVFDPEKEFSPFIDDRINAPSTFSAGYTFPMFIDEKELDDDMHMPMPDDDVVYRPKLRDYLTRDGILSLLGLLFLIVGLAFVFIGLPVLSYSGVAIIHFPYDTDKDDTGGAYEAPRSWAIVNTRKYPLLQNLRTGLIDPTTPAAAKTRTSVDGEELQLVFSDEFNDNNRTFYSGDDPYWTAPNFWYGATQDLEWYDPDAVTTYNGTLQLRLDQFTSHNLRFRSGMLNSWNQLCMKGGAFEVSISLAGPSGFPGLWPGVWTMGNLGRPGYKATTDGVWPYTYNSCDAGITPNQSSPDGISWLPGQKLASCTCDGADHPTPGTGRGAPEIDVIEASVDPTNRIGVVTQSYQVAPYDIWYQPDYEYLQIPNYNTTQMNSYCGGPYQQAISGTTLLNNAWYDQNEYQKYSFEYKPGTMDGEISWFVGDDVSYQLSGRALRPNGIVSHRPVSEEPMSIILNLGISNSWTWIDWPDLQFPTVMYIDYVRWYQKAGEESVTCDPPGYETTDYIANHIKAYTNSNLTAGITHCFVNLGSDHPSIIEAIVKGQNEKKGQFPKIVTCPNEMVALSMADGYARVTNKPQCVIVHVDVGTQGLGAAVHNASTGRCPVLIFAGLSPYTIEGEMRGSRTEFIHWIQDVPDQKAIVAQYCRYTGEIKTGKNVKQLVNRALQFATSDPKGPVYLVGAREAMEQDLDPYQLDQGVWGAVAPAALPQESVESIAKALVEAEEPLLITGYCGRNHAAVEELVKLADNLKTLEVLDTGGSDMSFPADHRSWLGVRYGVHESISTADVILVVDCDVPWIPTQCKPSATAKIFHIDVDPLKQQMPVFYVPASSRFRADAYTSFKQLNSYITSSQALTSQLQDTAHTERWDILAQNHKKRVQAISDLAKPGDDDTYGASFLISAVRQAVPRDSIFCIEAVTNTGFVADQIQATIPGQWLNCGGGGLGWSGGAALGIKLASDTEGAKKFVCQIVGDGTYLFSVPGSVYWISQRYGIPVLTIILNNQGWNAPRKSLLLVHPDGYGSKVDNHDLNISFAPTPDYAGIARAASGGHVWAGRAGSVAQLAEKLREAVAVVRAGTSAVLDAHLGGEEGKFVG
ncbi:MAG: hypothetical protein M1819_005290 [Sarea resinae]|nr:MAG: hypothetical protein M1819_005290 [Sarea resinae]